MNALLFAPALVFILARNIGPFSRRSFALIGIIVVFQLAVALPFITTWHDTAAYLSRAFEFSRIFMYQWTVNWKMLAPDVFTSQILARALLAGHLATLVVLGAVKWCAPDGGLVAVLRRVLMRDLHASPPFRDSAAFIVYTLLTANFVGIVFLRTLHYQFYTWYYHSLPFIVGWASALPLAVRLLCVVAIEYAFNVGDAQGAGSALSSILLQVAQGVLLCGVLASPVPALIAQAVGEEEAGVPAPPRGSEQHKLGAPQDSSAVASTPRKRGGKTS